MKHTVFKIRCGDGGIEIEPEDKGKLIIRAWVNDECIIDNFLDKESVNELIEYLQKYQNEPEG